MLNKIVNGSRLIMRSIAERRPSLSSFLVLSEASRWFIHVNLRDPRGRTLALNGFSQPHISDLWSALNETLRPTDVIDVGANYGEIGLGTNFSGAERVVLIEANPELCGFLNKTIAGLPFKEKVTLHNVLAGSEKDDGQTLPFYVDKDWSGMSSAVKPNTHQRKVDENHVVTRSLDHLMDGDFSDRKTLFKIDVEGFEASVIAGMNKILDDSKSIAGIIEFNKSLIAGAGDDPSQLFDRLLRVGKIYLIEEPIGGGFDLKEITRATYDDIEDLKSDILVVRNINIESILGSESATS